MKKIYSIVFLLSFCVLLGQPPGAQQNKDISDWLERYGNTPTGIGRILVKINSASWVLRRPYIA